MGTSPRGLRRAGVLTLAVLALAGCGGGGDIEFSEDAVREAVDAAVPTDRVMTTDEVYSAVEEQAAKLEESGPLDACAELALQTYQLQLDDRRPTVQADIAEDAVLIPGTFETLGATPEGEIEGMQEVTEQIDEQCSESTDEVNREESTVEDCELLEETYTRDGRPTRWTLVMTCKGVSVNYSSMVGLSDETVEEADFAPWREEATSRMTAVFDQLEG